MIDCASVPRPQLPAPAGVLLCVFERLAEPSGFELVSSTPIVRDSGLCTWEGVTDLEVFGGRGLKLSNVIT